MNIISLLKPKATVSFVYDSSTVRQGLEQMKAHKFTATPVIGKDGKYVGVVSEGDFLWYMVNNRVTADMTLLEDTYIKDIIKTGKHKPVRVTATMQDLLLLVMNQNFVPVIDDRNCFIGIITRKSVLEYFYKKEQENALNNSNEKSPVTA